MDHQQPVKKRERGIFFIVFGSIATLISIAMFVLAPMLIASTTSANKETGNFGSRVIAGLGLEWARGIAEAMDNLGLFFGIIGIGMIVIGVVRERRGRQRSL